MLTIRLQGILSATIATETQGVKILFKFWHKDIETDLRIRRKKNKQQHEAFFPFFFPPWDISVSCTENGAEGT